VIDPVPALSPYAKPGPYLTPLQPPEEQAFQQWVQTKHVPFDSSPQSDYDMRGWWKKNAGNLGTTERKTDGLHFSDEFKTPYHKTFSNESRYALPTAPHWDEHDRLIDQGGKVLADEGALKLPAYRALPIPALPVAPPPDPHMQEVNILTGQPKGRKYYSRD
jgi:hypothetical protein